MATPATAAIEDADRTRLSAHTTCRCAPRARARVMAVSTAVVAVDDPSVPTTIVWYMPPDLLSGCAKVAAGPCSARR
jgi:hypothetical protein